ncbi:hypothetical protein H6F74_17250 [Trichocoleus sp. FACHB-90]|uniref:hypothetical protein n=1 Tax=Cyanophyceae TaxID=3028117 RepID=UPI0016841EB7|nr:hypothetical protein [Trichocoleus sp. FACHB-90]MBD1927977.1 hypothetical protein [Trichocoleus sp. FACHB-90]
MRGFQPSANGYENEMLLGEDASISPLMFSFRNMAIASYHKYFSSSDRILWLSLGKRDRLFLDSPTLKLGKCVGGNAKQDLAIAYKMISAFWRFPSSSCKYPTRSD